MSTLQEIDDKIMDWWQKQEGYQLGPLYVQVMQVQATLEQNTILKDIHGSLQIVNNHLAHLETNLADIASAAEEFIRIERDLMLECEAVPTQLEEPYHA